MGNVNSPVLQLLQRSAAVFEGQSVIFAGEIYDPAVLHLAKLCRQAVILCDHFGAAQQMAAMLGQRLPAKLNAGAAFQHIEVRFTTPQLYHAAEGEEHDILCLLVHKTKAVNQQLCALFAPALKHGGRILAAGANDAGGRSADSYLKDHGACSKLDTARKCTLWQTVFDKTRPFVLPQLDQLTLPLSLLPESESRPEIYLLQDPAVFSPGRLDAGTAALIEALSHIAAPDMRALDLCCGCGAVGVCMAKAGLKTDCCDVSAAAVHLTRRNLQLNGCEDAARRVFPSFMLDDLPDSARYDLIAVNPPFHQGVSRNLNLSANLFTAAKAHLNPDGVLCVVGNTCLNYPQQLRELYPQTEILSSNPKFTVTAARLN